jgi:hypothetical protein
MSDYVLQVTVVVNGPLQGTIVQSFPLSPLSLFKTGTPNVSVYLQDGLLPLSLVTHSRSLG